MAYRCNLCINFVAITLSLLLNHVYRYHLSDPNFHALCGIDGCSRTYRKCVSFRNHIIRKHGDLLKAEKNSAIVEGFDGDAIESDEDVNMDGEDDPGTYDYTSLPQFDFQRESENIRRTGALHLLEMKYKDRVSQAGIDSFVENTTSIVRTSMQLLKSGLMNRLDTAGIDFSAVPGLPELFQEGSLAMNPFSGLRNVNEQNKYYKDHLNLVEPRKIVMGQYHKKVRRGSKLKDVLKTDDAYYIPLLESLEQLLNDDSILEEIDNPHTRGDDLLSDFCDGDTFRQHPIFSRDPKALQLILYFDEFEVCNPLGSRANKHKIGAFYYTLGNIRPENRSHKNATQLLGLATTKHLKQYGAEPLLDAFMQDLAQLEQDAGYQFLIDGEQRSLRGSIAFFCGDNLGCQFIGGFKEGSKARRPCRECMGDQNGIKTHFQERDFVLRTRESHNRQCHRLADNPHYSKTYGINSSSVLNKSRCYHVVGGMPPDAMHDILEGVLPYIVKETLKVFIFQKKLMTVDELNNRMSSFDYGYHNDANKPAEIKRSRLLTEDHTIKQHANQMWCLAINLPLLIGGLIPDDDEHWGLFCDLLEIMRIIFAPTVSRNQVAYLQVLIQNLIEKFKELYPECSIIPKMHYMIHMPRTILSNGPLVRSWCMRFEAKHHEFKRLAAHLGNFTNLPYSLAKRHQEGLCYRLQTSEGNLTSFIVKGIETGPGHCCYAGDVDYHNILSGDNPDVNNETPVTEFKWVSILGTKYKVGCTLQVGIDQYDSPVFGQVLKICMINGNTSDIMFVVSQLNTIEFSEHYQSFEVKNIQPRRKMVVHQKELSAFLPLNQGKPYGMATTRKYIVQRFDLGTIN